MSSVNSNAASSSSTTSASTGKKSSTLLAGFSIRLDGFDTQEEHKAKKIIQRLGGKVSDTEVNEKTTCLIAKRVGSKEYQMAERKIRVPIVVLQWLFDCYTQAKVLSFNSYKVAPFYGLTIACTQIVPEDRYLLQTRIEENGGTYSNNLVMGTCTHLIAREATGEKYMYAKSWKNVYVVNMQWSEECAKQKKWISEREYTVRPEKKPESKEAAQTAAMLNKERTLDFLLTAKPVRNAQAPSSSSSSSSSSFASSSIPTASGDGHDDNNFNYNDNGNNNDNNSSNREEGEEDDEESSLIHSPTYMMEALNHFFVRLPVSEWPCVDSIRFDSTNNNTNNTNSSSSCSSSSSSSASEARRQYQRERDRVRNLFRHDLFFFSGLPAAVATQLEAVLCCTSGRRSLLFYQGVTKVVLGPVIDPKFAAEIGKHPVDIGVVDVLFVLSTVFGVPSLVQYLGTQKPFSSVLAAAAADGAPLDCVMSVDRLVQVLVRGASVLFRLAEKKQREAAEAAEEAAETATATAATTAASAATTAPTTAPTSAATAVDTAEVRRRGGVGVDLDKNSSSSFAPFPVPAAIPDPDPFLEALPSAGVVQQLEVLNQQSKLARKRSTRSERMGVGGQGSRGRLGAAGAGGLLRSTGGTGGTGGGGGGGGGGGENFSGDDGGGFSTLDMPPPTGRGRNWGQGVSVGGGQEMEVDAEGRDEGGGGNDGGARKSARISGNSSSCSGSSSSNSSNRNVQGSEQRIKASSYYLNTSDGEGDVDGDMDMDRDGDRDGDGEMRTGRYANCEDESQFVVYGDPVSSRF